MLQSYSPVGKFIFLTSSRPGVLDDDRSLKNNLEKLVNSLKENIKAYGINESQQKMEDAVFSIRFDILEYLKAHPGLLEDIENTIIEQIGKKYFTTGKFAKLGHTVSDTLETYLAMFGHMAGEIINNISNIATDPSPGIPPITLSALRRINALQPNPELPLLIEWFAASVKYDFFLIVTEFVMNGDIDCSENETNTLIASLKNAIIDFGVYTTLSGLWKPKTDEESQIIRNIKIRVAAYKMNAGKGNSTSLEQLQNMLLS